MPNITIYTTPTCHYCKMAKNFFKEHSLEYAEKDVTTDTEARAEMIQQTGQLGVPVINVDGTFVIGFDEQKLAELTGVAGK